MVDHSTCSVFQGELAQAKDIGRNNYISFVFTNKNIWLGGRYEGNRYSGVWKWNDGSTFTFNRWNPGEPNNIKTGGTEFCLMTNWYNSGDAGWNNAPCNNVAAETVCQRAPL